MLSFTKICLLFDGFLKFQNVTSSKSKHSTFRFNFLWLKNANENGYFNGAASGSLQRSVLTNKSLIIKFWCSISFTWLRQTQTGTITNTRATATHNASWKGLPLDSLVEGTPTRKTSVRPLHSAGTGATAMTHQFSICWRHNLSAWAHGTVLCKCFFRITVSKLNVILCPNSGFA